MMVATMLVPAMLSLLLLFMTVAYAEKEQVPVRQYKVFEKKDWFRGHLKDTTCLSSNNNTTSPLSSLVCPIPNPYSPVTPLYVKLKATCDEYPQVCCLVQEESCVAGVVKCSTCGDCMYPQTVNVACCANDESCGESETCCKCGPDTFQCIKEGEECNECLAPTMAPAYYSEWMTTPTPHKLIHEEF